MIASAKPDLARAERLLAQYQHLRTTRRRGGFDRDAVLVWDEYEAELRRGRVRVKLHTVPRWLRKHLNQTLGLKISNRYNAGLFLMNGAFPGFSPRTSCRVFDHWGADPDDNLVAEPYAKNCVSCLTQAVAFAETLKFGLVISDDPWWAPDSNECVRITFSLEPRDLWPADAAAPWIAAAQAWKERLNKKENEIENSHSEN
jgi:hypothetical protein